MRQRASKQRLVILAAIGLLAAPACSARPGSAPPPPPRRRERGLVALRVTRLGVERAETLRALTMPHVAIFAALGAHRVEATSTLQIRTSERGERRVAQRVWLRVDRAGQFTVTKQTGPQYGQEVRWVGGKLYLRLRYSKFLARPPHGPGEPARIAERMVGLLPAYVRLLGRFMTVGIKARGKRGGRAALLLVLGKREEPEPPPRTGTGAPARAAAKRWRARVVVETLSGEVWLDAKTGAPLEARLKARWTFVEPTAEVSRTGIPRSFGSQRGHVALELTQRLVPGPQLASQGPRLASRAPRGSVSAIVAPTGDQLLDVRRRRLEFERQMVTGERPLVPHYRQRWGGIPK